REDLAGRAVGVDGRCGFGFLRHVDLPRTREHTRPLPRLSIFLAIFLARVATVLLVGAGVSCGASACGTRNGGADARVDEVGRARALATAPAAALPSRPEVLALAQQVAARAAREGAGVRAVELNALAGALLEREWRLEGREQDAKEAVLVLRNAARDPA